MEPDDNDWQEPDWLADLPEDFDDWPSSDSDSDPIIVDGGELI